MLSRTADHLFWMARYAERAENLARLLDVTWQMSMLPRSRDAERQYWRAVIVLNSLEVPFSRSYVEPTPQSVLEFMVRDESNPSSIYSCLRASRENAHAVRGVLTAEMWENVNENWIELRGRKYEDISSEGIGVFFDWVKNHASVARGAMFGTMLRDDAFHFLRLGALLEMADNTARILDAQYHALRPADDDEDMTDFYHWGALLRSVSAFEVYRKVYRDSITPVRVAELLIMRENLPRSLHSCLKGIVKTLAKLQGRSSETSRLAGQLYAQIQYGRIEDIFEVGLHEWLTEFMERIDDLGLRIGQDFLGWTPPTPTQSQSQTQLVV
jgi:uncharacterized alpha-E superfamily protein